MIRGRDIGVNRFNFFTLRTIYLLYPKFGIIVEVVFVKVTLFPSYIRLCYEEVSVRVSF
jgi:hypothetical protein